MGTKPGVIFGRTATAGMRRFVLSASILASCLYVASKASAQLALSGTSYVQSFDGVGTGLPTGFSVYTGATATTLGTLATFTTAQTTWGTSTGAFANAASSDGLTSSATTAQQNASTDRVISVQQTGSYGDPGASITLNFNASSAVFSGSGGALTFNLDMLNVQTRSTAYSIQIGTNATTFTTLGTYADPGVFGSTAFSFTGAQLASLSGDANAFIRIVALTASTGTGSRDRIGLDDLSLSYTAAGTTYQYFDVNGTAAGSGVTNGGLYSLSGSVFNSASDGTGTVGAFTSSSGTLTFSAGTDAATNTYTVTDDSAISTNGITFKDANVTLNAGSGSLTLVGSSVTVGAGDVATISAPLSGTVGLTKLGTGTLVLGGTLSNFTGTVFDSAGTLSISNDADLGSADTISLTSGSSLQATTNVSLASSRSLIGSGGLDVGVGNTLTINGPVNAGTITILNAGTVTFANASNSITGLTFSAAGTLNDTGGSPLVFSGTGGGITTTQTAGTATVNGAINLGSSARTISVADGSAAVDLLLAGNLTGTAGLSKTGTGTVELAGDNSGYSGTVTLGGVSTSQGTIGIETATALGTSTISGSTGLPTTNLNFDTGTLSNDSGTALSIAKGLSIGATTAGSGAVLAGSDMTFTVYEALYKGATGTTAQESLVVNNNTTFSGIFGPSTGSGTSTGLTISGTGKLTLTAANTFVEPLTITGVTLNAASASGQALANNTAFTVNGSGTLLFSTPSQVNVAAPITLNAGAISLANAATQGHGATRSGGNVSDQTSSVGFGALTLSGNSTLNYLGNAATAVFTSFDPTGGGAGTFTLNVTGSNFSTATDGADGTNNRLIFNQDVAAAGFLGDILFNGVADAIETPLDVGFYEITPGAVPEPGTVLGGLLLVGTLGWNQRRRLRGLAGLIRMGRAA